MLTFRREQIQALAADWAGRQRRKQVDGIAALLVAGAPELAAATPRAALLEAVADTIDAAQALDIADPEIWLNWAFISLSIGAPLHRGALFSHILGHPFLHPRAKGRHIVLAFFAARRVQQAHEATT